MHEASALVVGASLAAARAVWTGEAEHAVNVAGGLHHAMPDAGAGFCVYNDPAVAIAWLLEQGAERVAYVDVDVHHGDGVERAFWDDPRVLTISLHESGRYLFPGTGFPEDNGGPGAEGFAVNVALPPGTGDGALAAGVPRRRAAAARGVRARRCWSRSTAATATSWTRWRTWGSASTASGRRTPRCTSWRTGTPADGGSPPAAVATSSRRSCRGRGPTCSPRRPAGPSRRRRRCPRAGASSSRSGTACPTPARMTDGAHPAWADWADGYDPADAVDRAVLATQRAVFPANGLGGLLHL